MNISSTKPATSTGILPVAKSAFWTVYYFFYFLLTGQPDWKCESHEPPKPVIPCCTGGGHRANEEKHPSSSSKWNSASSYNNTNTTHATTATQRSNGHVHDEKNHLPQPYQSQNQPYYAPQGNRGFFGNLWAKTKFAASACWDKLKAGARWTGQKAKRGAGYVLTALSWLWAKLRGLCSYFSSLKLLPEEARSKSLPPPQVGPKPFCPDSPSFNKVAFDPEAPFQSFKQKLEAQLKDQFEDSQQEEEEEDPDERTLREPSAPPPPPPPPKSAIRIERTPEPESYRRELPQERKECPRTPKSPKGVPESAKELMAELNERLSRGPSASRELTQSCHPDMAQWKEAERYDRSGSATPWGQRSTSVGPTMRRLEQVVSRLDGNDSSDNEAQFVFRPPPTSTQQEPYQMGRSVFNPLEEAERMREAINNKQSFNRSRPVTPSRHYDGQSELRQRARTVEPSGHAPRPFTPSLAYSTAPFTSHTARRSKTPVSFDRGGNFAYDRNDLQDGVVSRTANRWPPVSNATGAVVEKDNWINDMMGPPDDDGLITTMCRRVVEKKTEDNWKWRDDAGRLVDEQNQRQWKGELDTVVRDGPEQGRQWSRTVEMRPNGTTLFQDVSRQYDRNYVVESVVRNY